MRGSQHIEVVDERPPAVEAAVVHEHRHPRELQLLGLVAAHDAAPRARDAAFWGIWMEKT